MKFNTFFTDSIKFALALSVVPPVLLFKAFSKRNPQAISSVKGLLKQKLKVDAVVCVYYATFSELGMSNESAYELSTLIVSNSYREGKLIPSKDQRFTGKEIEDVVRSYIDKEALKAFMPRLRLPIITMVIIGAGFDGHFSLRDSQTSTGYALTVGGGRALSLSGLIKISSKRKEESTRSVVPA